MFEPEIEVVDVGDLRATGYTLDATVRVDGRLLSASITWGGMAGTNIAWEPLEDGPAYEPDILDDPDDVAWAVLAHATGISVEDLRRSASGQLVATWLTNAGLLAAATPRVRDTATTLASEGMPILGAIRSAGALG